MPVVKYRTAFNFTLKDHTVFHVQAGEQEVPQEIADSPLAQFHQEEVPDEVKLRYTPPYGVPGHELHKWLEGQGVPKAEQPLDEIITAGQQAYLPPYDQDTPDSSLMVPPGMHVPNPDKGETSGEGKVPPVEGQEGPDAGVLDGSGDGDSPGDTPRRRGRRSNQVV